MAERKPLPIQTRTGPCCPYCEAPLDARPPLKDGTVLWDCAGCIGVWIHSGTTRMWVAL